MTTKEFIDEMTAETPYGELKFYGRDRMTPEKAHCAICEKDLSSVECDRLVFKDKYPQLASEDNTIKFVCLEHYTEE